jgi:hypothetical protein
MAYAAGHQPHQRFALLGLGQVNVSYDQRLAEFL